MGDPLVPTPLVGLAAAVVAEQQYTSALLMVMGQGPSGPSGQRPPLMIPMRGPTIYGRTEIDLAGSMGPVPIMFSIDPPHVIGPHPFSNAIPASLASPSQGTPTSKPTMPSSPPHSPVQMMTKQEPQRSMSLLELTGAGSGSGAPVVVASVGNVGPSAEDGDVPQANEPKPVGDVIPRANFLPKLPGLRPRSRSFSGFNSTNAQVPLSLQRR